MAFTLTTITVLGNTVGVVSNIGGSGGKGELIGLVSSTTNLPISPATDDTLQAIAANQTSGNAKAQITSLPALAAGSNVIGGVTVSGTPTVTANEGTPTNVSTIQGAVAVAATTTSTQLLAANASRNGVTINNTSTTGTLYLLYGSGTASATNCTYAIGPTGTFEMPAKLVYKGQINGVWSVAGSGGAYGSEL